MKYLLCISLLVSASLAIPRERVRVFQYEPDNNSAVFPAPQQGLSGSTMERLDALASRHLADFDRTFSDDDIPASVSTSARGLDGGPMTNIERNDIDYPLTEVLIPGISKRTHASKTTATTTSSPSFDPTTTTSSVSSYTASGSSQTSEAVSFSGTPAPAQTAISYTTTSATLASTHSDSLSETVVPDETSAYSETISATQTHLPSSSFLESATSTPSVSIQTIVSTYTLTVVSLAKPTTSPAHSSTATTTAQPAYASESGTLSSTPVLSSTLNSDSETSSKTELVSDNYASSTQVAESTSDITSSTETQTYLVIVMPSTNVSTSTDSSASGSSLSIKDSTSTVATSDCSEESSLYTDVSSTDTIIESAPSDTESSSSSSSSSQGNIYSDEYPPITSDSSTTQATTSSSTSNIAYSADTLPTYLTTTSASPILSASFKATDSSTPSPAGTSIAYIDDDPLSTLSLTPESETDFSTTDLYSFTASPYLSTTSAHSSENEDTQIDKTVSASTRPVHPTLGADYTATISIELLPIRVSSSAVTRTSRRLDHHKPIYSLPPHPLKNVDQVSKPAQTEPYLPPHPTSDYTPLYTSSHTYHTTSYSSAYDQDSSYKVSRQHGHDHKHSREHGRHSHKDHSSSSSSSNIIPYYPTSTYYFPSDEADGISQAMAYRNKAAFISAVRANITPTVEH